MYAANFISSCCLGDDLSTRCRGVFAPSPDDNDVLRPRGEDSADLDSHARSATVDELYCRGGAAC